MNISHSQNFVRSAVRSLAFLATGLTTSVVCGQALNDQDRTDAVRIELPGEVSLEPESSDGPLVPISESDAKPPTSILTNKLPPPGNEPEGVTNQGFGQLNLGSRKSIAKVVGSLAIVIAIFLIFAKLLGKRSARRPGALPHEVVRIQGTVPMDKKRDLMLIQMGAKLLLVVKSEQGIAPLGEVDDPQQVEWMIRKCNGGKNTNADLQNMLEQLMAGEDSARYQNVPSRPEPPQPAANQARQRVWMSGSSARKPGRALFEA